MASLAPGAVLHQEVLVAFVLIRTDEIDVPDDRLRAIDPVWGGAVGKMMKRDGQDTPIKVCRLPGRSRWTLVAGAHRHYGATVEGIEFLKAEVVTSERDERRLHEVRENLFRTDLTPIDRALSSQRPSPSISVGRGSIPLLTGVLFPPPPAGKRP